MSNTTISEILNGRDWVLADGATGTNYFSVGLQSGDSPELWNIDHPERVATLHREFIDAGSDIILTNSFGGTSCRLTLHGSEDRVRELNRAAAFIARNEADRAKKNIVVAASIGPTGDLIYPLGDLQQSQAEDAFAEQADALKEGGADVIWLETMSSKEEFEAARIGAQQVGLPIVATMTFDTKGRTMMGVAPQELVFLYRDLVPKLAAYGSNCGIGASDLIGGIMAMRTVADESDVLIAKSNCGIPEFVDGKIRYSGTPELMAEYACLARDLNVQIIGGCCGTTPEHLRSMCEALETRDRRPPPSLDDVVSMLGPITDGTKMCFEDFSQHKRGVDVKKRGQRRNQASQDEI